MKLPREFEEEMKLLLGTGFDEYGKSLEMPAVHGLRINRLKTENTEWERITPFSAKKIPWISNGYFLNEEDKASRHPYYYAGLYYLQEPSAMTPASRLPIEEGDYVLDLCAAPGGKATELGARLNRTGMLIANDISNSRAKALLKNLEMAGIPNIFVTSEAPEILEKHFPGYFDKILIDAPCSGEGMFRREPKMAEYWQERGPEAYVPIQKDLILRGSHMLKPGGMLLYSTCTFSVKEDEEVIKWLLSRERDMELLKILPYEGFSEGFELSDCVRIFPHKMQGEGHFMALLGKKGGSFRRNGSKKSEKKVCLPECAEEFLANVKLPFDRGRFLLEKDRLYLLPSSDPMPKLRYLRTGLYLGDVKKNRFEPSQALAMALTKEQFVSVIRLEPDDIRTIKYLKGETIDVSDIPVERKKGWQLVCVKDYPLGFGKLSNGILKNKYYAGWRWQ